MKKGEVERKGVMQVLVGRIKDKLKEPTTKS